MNNNPFTGLTADEAKKKFRKMCFDAHPDLECGSSEKFIKLQKDYKDFCRNYNDSHESDRMNYGDDFMNYFNDLDPEMKQTLRDVFSSTKYGSIVKTVANSGLFSTIFTAFGKHEASQKAKDIENMFGNLLGEGEK